MMNVNIPNSCTEKYDNMSPTELGRLCKVCNTQVVDFTNWETTDIVEYIQKSHQKVCGKLEIQKDEIRQVKRSLWSKYVAAILAFGSLDSFSYANSLSFQHSYPTKSYNLVDTAILHIVDSKNNSLPDVLLINQSNNQKFHTDKNGHVKLPIIENEKYIIAYIGYKKQELKINKATSNKTLKVILKEDSYEIGEVIVEPLNRLKPIINSETNLSKNLTKTSSTTHEVSLKQKLKRLLNTFSVRDNN